MIQDGNFVVPAHVTPDLVVDFDYLRDPGLSVDPHATYQKLAGGPPLVWTGRNGGHWISTRHQAINDVFLAHDLFSNFPRMIPNTASLEKPQPFSDINPPDNLKYRRALQLALSPKALERFRVEARRIMVELVDEVQPRGRCDFAAEIAMLFPTSIIMRWLDLPMEDMPLLVELTDRAIAGTDPEDRKAAKLATRDYVDAIVRARREQPGEDFISVLANARIGDRTATHEEARAMTQNVIGGGLDTVRNMMSFIALFLARNPEHRRQLVDEPELIPGAVEELLRYLALPNMGRSVTRDAEFHGVQLRKGDMMLLPLCLAGRDGEAHADADAVDFRRERNRHLAFGTGAHLCPGMYLARAELAIFLEEWLKRIPDFQIAPGAPPVTRGGNILAVKSLVLEWTA
ncbi:MAG TPA: cytochrome P450 [Allosphingosinicella sp.]|jgi:cytochrome P450|nr:cytochrome P450 [Allosphingosinicella sp.]